MLQRRCQFLLLTGSKHVDRRRACIGGSIALLLTVTPTHSWAQLSNVLSGDAGALWSNHTRHGESFDGSSNGIAGWFSLGTERFRLQFDVSRTDWRSSGNACADPTCSRTTQAVHFERNWTTALAAQWRLRAAAVAPHLLIGIGSIHRAFVEEGLDPAVGTILSSESNRLTLVGGVGLDFPRESRVFGRAQYLLNFSVPESIHQLRVGAGVRF